MVVVIVRNKNDVDGRESVNRNTGFSQARNHEAESERVYRIGDDVNTVQFNENCGVIDVGDFHLGDKYTNPKF